MRLYYTTSAGYEEPQTVVAKSLGGYRSSNVVKNDDFDNLFGEISAYTIREQRNEYIALILRNELGVQVDNVEAWFVLPMESYSILEIAGVTTVDDADGNPIMERVRTRFTRPFVGTFIEASDTNRLSIGTMVANAEVGIWIKRIIDRTTIDTALETIYERDPNNINIYREVELDREDTITFIINWDVIYRAITAVVTVARDSASQVTYSFSVSTTEAVINDIPVSFTIQNANGNSGSTQHIVTILQGQLSETDTLTLTGVSSTAYSATITSSVPVPHDVTVNNSVDIPSA